MRSWFMPVLLIIFASFFLHGTMVHPTSSYLLPSQSREFHIYNGEILVISGTGEANTTNLTVLVDSSPVVLKGGSHVVFRNLTGEIQVEASNSSDLVHVVVKPSGNVRNIYIAAGGSGSLAILVYWYTLRTRARRH